MLNNNETRVMQLVWLGLSYSGGTNCVTRVFSCAIEVNHAR